MFGRLPVLGVPDGNLRSSWDNTSRIAQRADALGFRNILCPSSYQVGQDTLSFVAAMAPLTKNINLLGAIRCGEMQPVMLARTIATLDHMLKGRFIMGISPGGLMSDAEVFGSLDKDRRTTIIHSQFVRKDQLDKYVTYKIRPSFYTLHTYFFAEAHIANRGKEQAMYISPMRDAIDAGLRPTNHTDFVVAPLDQMFMLWSAVNRISRAGAAIGPDQRAPE